MRNVIRVYRRLFCICPSQRWRIPLQAILTIVQPLLESAIPAMVIGMILERNIVRYIIGICVLLLVDVIIRIAITFLKNRFEDDTVQVRVEWFWSELLKKDLTTDYCNVEPAAMQNKMQKGMNALNGNTVGVHVLYNGAFELVCYLFGLVSYGAIILTIDIRVLLIMVVMSVVSFLLHRNAVKYSDKNTKERDQARRVLGETTWQARQPDYGKDIRIYHVERWFSKVFRENISRLSRWNRRVELRWYFPTLSDSVFGIARDLLMYFLLIQSVLQGDMSITAFTFYIGVVSGFASWLSNFFFKISAVMRTNLETKAFYEVMDLQDSFCHGRGEELDLSAPVSIEFRDVSFHYEEGEDILSHLSFRIEKGQKIALVGNNGAGKTTIVKLLCGFYLPTEGEVLINGIPTSEYNMDTYRDGISAVFQDGFITPLSVAMNVGGDEEENIDRKRVRECLKQAGIWEKIKGLPDQEDSYFSQKLNKNGVDFSGGECQKLLIARALYQNGRLLILDEPTSALDPLAESNIYEKYNEMTEGRTSLFISHRLASTKFCDEILFMEKGNVLERGTHEQLLEQGGEYARMFEIQSHYYKEEVSEA